VTSDLDRKSKMRPFLACAMHPVIIIEKLCSLWTRLWDRYHVPQNVFLVLHVTTSKTEMQMFKLPKNYNSCKNLF